MSDAQQDEVQPENGQDGTAADAPAKPKISPLEAKKAQQAAMRAGKGGPPHASGGGSQAGGGGASARKPAIQSRKMG